MVLGLGGLAIVVVVWFCLQVVPLGGPGHWVIVTVKPGDSVGVIAGKLQTKGVVGSSLALRIDTLLFGAPTIQAGSYQIRQNSSFSTVKSLLGAGPNVSILSVTAGLTLHEVALRVAGDLDNTFANSFVLEARKAAAASPFKPGSSLEGLIAPGDYILRPGETPAELVAAMTKAFSVEAASVGFTSATRINGLNAYQLLIAASIVEKEGYYPSNMPKVARVIFNRLEKKGSLQMDSTILYALNKDGGAVTHAMLRIKSPYNTYLVNGLTPTPICTVSTFALNAMLHAPPGPWLYFTVIDQGGHEAFATTFSEQLANERLAATRGIG